MRPGMVKTIGLIGAGMIGSALARLAVAAGYDVVLSNARGPETLAGLVAELGAKARAATVAEAIDAADLVIASVPLGAFMALPADRLAGRIVIDTMNYYPSVRDDRLPSIDAGKLTTSEMVQQHLKHAKVVKALHNLDFHHLFKNARPSGDSGRTTLPIAGDDEPAKKTVARFMDTIGYDAVDIGPLAESWRIEPGTPIYVWPYVPRIPKGLTEEEARNWYLEKPGDPLSTARVKELVASTQRHFPAGGSPQELPAIHLSLVSEVYKSRK
jgi:predicted dinucleotide-binding enzyme